MLDGPIFAEDHDRLIYIEVSKMLKGPLLGHTHSYFCWCQPLLVDYRNPDGLITKEPGHKNVMYDFGGHYEPEK